LRWRKRVAPSPSTWVVFPCSRCMYFRGAVLVIYGLTKRLPHIK
jgi:hypothetical protein